VQGPRSSAEPSLSTPRDQTAVGLTCVKQTDQICVVSKEIWSSSYSLCRWMGGIRCGFCMVFMIEVGLERLRLGQGSCSVHARQGQCACRRDPSLLPSAAAGAFPHLPIYRLSRPFFCRPNRLPELFCFVKSVSQPRRLVVRSVSNINKPAQSASSPPNSHAPRRRIPLFTSSITASISAHPTSPISINTRLLRPPFSQLPRLPSIQQSSSCCARPDCRVARRICRIRSAHALIQQEWSVLMAT
jgi:hypothetical protein